MFTEKASKSETELPSSFELLSLRWSEAPFLCKVALGQWHQRRGVTALASVSQAPGVCGGADSGLEILGNAQS